LYESNNYDVPDHANILCLRKKRKEKW